MRSEMNDRARVPITVVAGPCGEDQWSIVSGLASPDGVVVSAAAPPGPIPARVVLVEEEVFWANPRCPCCAVRFDLLSVVPLLARSQQPVPRIVVTAGSDTDLTLIAQTLLADAEVERLAELDAVVVTVDARQASARLATGGPLAPSGTAADQLALADHVVVAGADQLTEEGLVTLATALRNRNPLSAVWLCDAHEIDTTLLTGVRSFDPATVAERASSAAAPAAVGADGEASTLVFDLDGELDGDLLLEWLDRMITQHGHDLLRLRAVFQVQGRPARRVCWGVRTCIGWSDEAAPSPARASSRVVLVGRGLDAGVVRDWLSEALA